MEKSFKKRFMFWGLIFLIVVGLGVYGIYSFYDGYGKIGSARKKLLPISNEFNNLDLVIRYGGIKSEVDGDKIIVTYSTKSVKKTFIYQYVKENDKELITNTYSQEDAVVGEMIAKGMVDSVFHINSGVESVFDTYKFQTFENVSIDSGVSLETIDSNTKNRIKIDVNKNIMASLDMPSNVNDDENNPTESNNLNIITKEDLSDVKSRLSVRKEVKFSKNTITMYIKENDDNYEIYANDLYGISDNLSTSISNAVNAINTDAYNEAFGVQETYKNDYEGLNYKVEVNVEVDDAIRDEFTINTGIVKVTVKKGM